MPNQKLLETLNFFSKQEKKRLQQFVASPYHNKKFNASKINRLLDRILKDKLQTDKEALNQAFFPNSHFKQMGKNPIDSLASDLLSLVRKFITYEQINNEQYKAQEYLAMARFYRKNNLENRFKQTINQFRSYQKKLNIKDALYYLQLFRIEEEVAMFQSMFNAYTADPNLAAVNLSLDHFYIISKLEYHNALEFQKKLGQIQDNETLHFTNTLKTEFPLHQALHSPLAVLNYQILQLLESPLDTVLFDEFSKEIEKNKTLIPFDKLRNIMAFYRYFIGKQYQLEASGQNLLNKIFLIYKEHLTAGYFFVNDKQQLHSSSLKVMTNIALKTDNVQWAKSLLDSYPPSKITGTHYQTEAHSLCVAEVLFYEQKHEESETQLTYRNFESVNYSILADVLLIKIYYATEHELLDSRIAALSQKIRRSKLTPLNKKKYLNFIKMVKQICKFHWTKNKTTQQSIERNLNELVPVIEREWLQSIMEAK